MYKNGGLNNVYQKQYHLKRNNWYSKHAGNTSKRNEFNVIRNTIIWPQMSSSKYGYKNWPTNICLRGIIEYLFNVLFSSTEQMSISVRLLFGK